TRERFLWRKISELLHLVEDFLLDAVAALQAVLEADQTPIGILALNSTQRWRDRLSLPVSDFATCCFHPVVRFGRQGPIALAAPGTWGIIGPLDRSVLLGRPSPLVLRPDPAGLFCLLVPLLGCGLLLGRDPLHGGGLFRGNGRTQVGVVLLTVAGLGFGVAGLDRLAVVILGVSAICVPVWWLICLIRQLRVF